MQSMHSSEHGQGPAGKTPAGKPRPSQLDSPVVARLYADFATYQAWTDRRIPVAVCEPLP